MMTTGSLTSWTTRAAIVASVALLAACEPTPEVEEGPAPYTGIGMSEAEAEQLVGDIFFAAGCSMTLSEYLDALDARGFDPDLIDVTTPEGHLAMTNRAILESTPMLMADTDQFKRRGSTLTSKIGGCADAPSSTS